MPTFIYSGIVLSPEELASIVVDGIFDKDLFVSEAVRDVVDAVASDDLVKSEGVSKIIELQDDLIGDYSHGTEVLSIVSVTGEFSEPLIIVGVLTNAVDVDKRVFVSMSGIKSLRSDTWSRKTLDAFANAFEANTKNMCALYVSGTEKMENLKIIDVERVSLA